jgi:putative transcriptional regulator
MARVRTTFEALRANPSKLTLQEQARLDAMTEEDIERNAASEGDDASLTEERIAQGLAARAVRLARSRTGLSQAKFAERFHINPARLRDWEQGRHRPDSVALAYLKVIETDPEAVLRALADGTRP